MLDHLNTLSTKTKKTRITPPLKMAFPFSHDISNDHKGGEPLTLDKFPDFFCTPWPFPYHTFAHHDLYPCAKPIEWFKIRRAHNWILQRLNLNVHTWSKVIRRVVWSEPQSSWSFSLMASACTWTNRVHVVLLNSKETTKNSSLIVSQVHCSNKLLKLVSL